MCVCGALLFAKVFFRLPRLLEILVHAEIMLLVFVAAPEKLNISTRYGETKRERVCYAVREGENSK